MSQLTDKLDDLVSETTKRMNEHNVMVEALREIAAGDPCPASPNECKFGFGGKPRGCVGCIARRALRFVEGDSK